MDYEIRNLGTEQFEHMAQSLVLKLLGADVGIFGPGPDGGREATFEGSIEWADGIPAAGSVADAKVWDGYVVAQAKFRSDELDPQNNFIWLRNTLTKELNLWDKDESRRKKLGRLPEYLLIITNVRLSSVENGGIDSISTFLDKRCSALGMKGWRLWHRDSISRLLDLCADVRAAYRGLLTTGDVLEGMKAWMVGDHSERVTAVVRSHAAKELLDDQWVRLGQAGEPESGKLALNRIAIDLPVVVSRPALEGPERKFEGTAIRHVLQAADLTFGGDNPFPLEHILLLGGPGQGKTRISQMLAQLYRLEFVRDVIATLPQNVRELAASADAHFAEQAIPRPKNRRWPFRIDLAKLADVKDEDYNRPIVQRIARELSRRGDSVSSTEVHRLLGAWPWLLILDGFDEVYAPEAREQVTSLINDFLIDAAARKADVFVVATTRPQGYGNELAGNGFRTVRLVSLGESRALEYAKTFARVRHEDDDVMYKQTIQRIGVALDDSESARLMRTPLQVTIMAILLERRASPPRDRAGLYDAYYETIYSREAAKQSHLGVLLSKHKEDIDAVHARVGFGLQNDTGHTSRYDQGMPKAAVRDIVRERLAAEGHTSSTLQRLTDQLLEATLNRLVLLVPVGMDNVGFELRSLQEFMAARELVGGADDAVLARMTKISTSGHWRNTWLLASALLFKNREYLRDALLGTVHDAGLSSTRMMVIPIEARLSMDLLVDGTGSQSPRYWRQLAEMAAGLLAYPAGRDTPVLQAAIESLGEDSLTNTIVIKAMNHAARSSFELRSHCYVLSASLVGGVGAIAARARQLVSAIELDEMQRSSLQGWSLTADFDARSQVLPTSRARHVADLVMSSVRRDNPEAPVLVEACSAFMSNVGSWNWSSFDADPDMILSPSGERDLQSAWSPLQVPDVADAIASAVMQLDAKAWQMSSLLRSLLATAVEMTPVQLDPVGD
jgi:hypothetical protein